MALVILRCVYLAVAIALGFQLLGSDYLRGENRWLPWIGFFGVLLVALSGGDDPWPLGMVIHPPAVKDPMAAPIPPSASPPPIRKQGR